MWGGISTFIGSPEMASTTFSPSPPRRKPLSKLNDQGNVNKAMTPKEKAEQWKNQFSVRGKISYQSPSTRLTLLRTSVWFRWPLAQVLSKQWHEGPEEATPFSPATVEAQQVAREYWDSQVESESPMPAQRPYLGLVFLLSYTLAVAVVTACVFWPSLPLAAPEPVRAVPSAVQLIRQSVVQLIGVVMRSQ